MLKRIFTLFMIYCVILSSLNLPLSYATELSNNNEELIESVEPPNGDRDEIVTDIDIEDGDQDELIEEDTDNNVNPNENQDDEVDSSEIIEDKDTSEKSPIEATEQPRGRFLVRFQNDQSNGTEWKSTGINVDSLETSLKSQNAITNGVRLLRADLGKDIDSFNIFTVDAFNTAYMELTPDELNRLSDNPTVISIEEDRPIEIAEDSITEVNPQDIKEQAQTIPWGIHSTGSYITYTQKGKGLNPIKVAVFDTGINKHNDLNIAGGVSYIDGTTFDDEKGHGTHVAGTIAAIDNEYGVIGTNPSTELYAVKVADTNGKGYTSSVIQGLQWAIENNINIVNMSFVLSQNSEILHEAIKVAKENGIILIAAAGNTGSGVDMVQYPAKYPEVIAVGAVDPSHHRLDFSSTGPELNLVAPGFGIVSTTLNNEYGVSSGTSTATAHVSGSAALLWSYHPEWTGQQVIQALLDSATHLGDTSEYGNGLINVAKAEGIISGSIAPLSEENLSGLNEVIPTSDPENELEVASYNKQGDGATISPGESATVSLKLEGDNKGNNPHKKIIIEVVSASNPKEVIERKTINNPSLDVDISFTWQTSTTTPTGTYYIKYDYPDLVTNNYTDTFVIYVGQPGVGPDTYEPNDTVITAKEVLSGQSYVSYISSSSDVDYYKFTAQNAGEISFDLKIPSSVDYEMAVYNEAGTQIGKSSNGTGVNEYIELQVSTNKTYYIKITGFSGQFSTLPYTLTLSQVQVQPFPAPVGLEAVPYSNSIKLTWEPAEGAVSYLLRIDGKSVGKSTTSSYTFVDLQPFKGYSLEVAAVYSGGTSKYSSIEASTSIPELVVNVPQDIEKSTGTSQLFSFRPATTGVYRFYTSPFGGTGKEVDTTIKIFSSAKLDKLISENDDKDDSTVLSELSLSLVAGETYYVQVSGYGSTSLHARITADVISSSIPYIVLDQAEDIDEKSKDSNTYIFIPPTSGQYRVATSKYRGNKASKLNDTKVHVFSDAQLETLVENGTNDDYGDSVYSEVVVNLLAGAPYYIRVDEAHGQKVYARLLVTFAGESSFEELKLGQPVKLKKDIGNSTYLQFTPTNTGMYRFFTSNYDGMSAINDTAINIFRDINLRELVDFNDDVQGYAPYGELFSKLELQLIGGTTYYIQVKNPGSDLNASLTVENMLQSSIMSAREIPLNELINTDQNNNPLQISSLYDVDYYKITLDQTRELSFYLSQGEGVIEDSNGNIRGYFGPEHEQVFKLPKGIFYLRVENDAIHTNRKNIAKVFTPYSYELAVDINEVEYINGSGSAAPQARFMLPNNIDSSFDATPGTYGKSNLKFKLKNNNKKEIFYIVETMDTHYEVYRGSTKGNFSKNQNAYVNWNGNVANLSSPLSHYYANYSDNKKLYWAKTGIYRVLVYTEKSPGRKDQVQYFNVEVFNDPLHDLNLIPIPPMYHNGKKIVASNKGLQSTVNYYNRYVLGPNVNVGLTDYDYWFEQMYGTTGLKKFWNTAEEIIVCTSGSPIDRLQCTIDIIGMVPVLGEAADGVNGVIYMIRGKKADALLSFASMVPVLGNFVSPAKKTTALRKIKPLFKANPCGCLPAGTQITTKDGSKPIEKIKVGDLVLAKDIDTGIQDYKPVEMLFNNQADQIYTITVGSTKIETTGNHPFWIVGKGWIEAENLVAGDPLEIEDGTVHQIKSIHIKNEPTEVYNFTVTDFHTYYVSELGVLTHNLSKVCQIGSYAKVTTTRLTGRTVKNASDAGAALTAEITKATGMAKPNNWAAHHIIPHGATDANAVAAQKIMSDFNIDLNSSANGVFLPRETGELKTVIDGQIMATHNGRHADTYYEFVYKEIKDVKSQEELLNKINKIREGLMNGDIVLGKIKK